MAGNGGSSFSLRAIGISLGEGAAWTGRGAIAGGGSGGGRGGGGGGGGGGGAVGQVNVGGRGVENI